MSSLRYDNRLIAINGNTLYREYFKNRGVKTIEQYSTPRFRYPTEDEIAELNLINHIWVVGDRYYKLAHEHYGDPELSWIIAMFNQKPTEAFVGQGTLIYIPTPLDIVISYFTVDEEDE